MRLEFFLTFVLSTIGVFAQTCTWNAYAPDPSGILSNIAAIQTLYIVEAYYYTNCSGQVATGQETAIIAGTTFVAEPPVTFTFSATETDLFVTHYFPEITLTSLTVGEEITVSGTVYGSNTEVDGYGLITFTVPFQVQEATPTGALTTVTSTTLITTTWTTTKSTGVSPGAVGGIAAGIVGGFLLIGAGAFFILFYKHRPTPPVYPGESGYEAGPPATKEPKQTAEEAYAETGVRPVSGRLAYLQ